MALTAENLLPPYASPSSQPGSPLLSPWRCSDGVDDTNVSVRLGSPDGKDAGWIEFLDTSEINTANARMLGLPIVSKGSFSFEIFLAKDAPGGVAVSLGIDKVAEKDCRLITWIFLADGTVRISSHDELLGAPLRYEQGIPQKFRCVFDVDTKGSATLVFYADAKNGKPAAEVHLPGSLPPIDGVRVTSTQRGTNMRWFVRNLVLKKD